MMESLREITKVKQTEPGLTRRWWTSAGMDVYVWQGAGRKLTAFEICYNKPYDEHSLRWNPDDGYRHHRIDDGESTAFDHRTPIAVPDGEYQLTDIASHLEAAGSEMDSDVYLELLALLR